MAARAKIKLDSAGIRAVLLSGEVASVVHSSAASVAANVPKTISRGRAMPVEVEDGRSDRARSVVVVKHPAALGAQGKYGILTRAAAAAGLEVNAR